MSHGVEVVEENDNFAEFHQAWSETDCVGLSNSALSK
jgi:hypothetical protein